MKITAITPQKNNSEKVNVFIDGKYSFSLSAKTWFNKQNKLEIGNEINEEIIEELKNEDSPTIAFMTALNYISYSMRTEKELRDKLYQKGFSEENINFAIVKAKEYKYIDDRHYAELYIKDKTECSHWGEQKIKTNLYKKGIEEKDFEGLFEELYNEDLKIENAYNQGIKKLKTLSKYDERKQKQKIFSCLVSKGFKYDTIKKVMMKIFSDNDFECE